MTTIYNVIANVVISTFVIGLLRFANGKPFQEEPSLLRWTRTHSHPINSDQSPLGYSLPIIDPVKAAEEGFKFERRYDRDSNADSGSSSAPQSSTYKTKGTSTSSSSVTDYQTCSKDGDKYDCSQSKDSKVESSSEYAASSASEKDTENYEGAKEGESEGSEAEGTEYKKEGEVAYNKDTDASKGEGASSGSNKKAKGAYFHPPLLNHGPPKVHFPTVHHKHHSGPTHHYRKSHHHKYGAKHNSYQGYHGQHRGYNSPRRSHHYNPYVSYYKGKHSGHKTPPTHHYGPIYHEEHYKRHSKNYYGHPKVAEKQKPSKASSEVDEEAKPTLKIITYPPVPVPVPQVQYVKQDPQPQPVKILTNPNPNFKNNVVSNANIQKEVLLLRTSRI